MLSKLGLLIAIIFAGFYILAIMSSKILFNELDSIFSIMMLACFVVSLIIIILIIIERFKDKEEEKNDIDKYR